MIEPANPRCEHLFRHIEKIVRKCFLDITTDLLCFPFYEMHYFSDVCEFEVSFSMFMIYVVKFTVLLTYLYVPHFFFV